MRAFNGGKPSTLIGAPFALQLRPCSGYAHLGGLFSGFGHWNTRLAVTGTMFPLLSRTRLRCRQTKQWGVRTNAAPFLY